MAIDKQYFCNLCRVRLHPGASIGFRYRPIGIRYSAHAGWQEVPYPDTDVHLCATCISSIQAFEPRCGQGYKCSGGSKCASSHK